MKDVQIYEDDRYVQRCETEQGKEVVVQVDPSGVTGVSGY